MGGVKGRITLVVDRFASTHNGRIRWSVGCSRVGGRGSCGEWGDGVVEDGSGAWLNTRDGSGSRGEFTGVVVLLAELGKTGIG